MLVLSYWPDHTNFTPSVAFTWVVTITSKVLHYTQVQLTLSHSKYGIIIQYIIFVVTIPNVWGMFDKLGYPRFVAMNL